MTPSSNLSLSSTCFSQPLEQRLSTRLRKRSTCSSAVLTTPGVLRQRVEWTKRCSCLHLCSLYYELVSNLLHNKYLTSFEGVAVLCQYSILIIIHWLQVKNHWNHLPKNSNVSRFLFQSINVVLCKLRSLCKYFLNKKL